MDRCTHADKHATVRCSQYKAFLQSVWEFTLPLPISSLSLCLEIFSSAPVLWASLLLSNIAWQTKSGGCEPEAGGEMKWNIRGKKKKKRPYNRMNMKVDIMKEYGGWMWSVKSLDLLDGPLESFRTHHLFAWWSLHEHTHSLWTRIQQVHVHRTGISAHTLTMSYWSILASYRKKKAN